jgi:Tol biopolymer transport system component
LDPHPIPGTDTGALNLLNFIFSPDGQSIAFWKLGSDGATLMRVPVAGGTALSIANTEIPYGASWGPDGILFGQGANGILRVSPNGGTPEPIIKVARDELAHGPQMLPDGRTVLFTLAKTGSDDAWDKAKIVAQSLADGTRTVLIDGGSDGRYVSSGHLVYAVGGTLFAVAFDAKTLSIKGSPVPVLAGVRRVIGGSTGATQLSISDSGTLVYLPGPAGPAAVTIGTVVIGDGRGEPVPLQIPPGQYTHPRVSPDGKVLAVGRNEGAQSDIWAYDLSGQTEIRRLTFGGTNRFPVWSSDGRRVTFQSARGGNRAIYWQAADGAGAADRLTNAAEGEAHVPESWSPDGTHLLFSVVKGTTYSLWVLRLIDRKTESFGTVQSIQPLSAVFSPDGRWVAYAFSDQPGGLSSPNRGVFVEPFPPTEEKYQVPKSAVDFHPVWSRDGKAILYIPSSTSITVSVPVLAHPSLAFGKPVQLPRVPRPGQLSTAWLRCVAGRSNCKSVASVGGGTVHRRSTPGA